MDFTDLFSVSGTVYGGDDLESVSQGGFDMPMLDSRISGSFASSGAEVSSTDSSEDRPVWANIVEVSNPRPLPQQQFSAPASASPDGGANLNEMANRLANSIIASHRQSQPQQQPIVNTQQKQMLTYFPAGAINSTYADPPTQACTDKGCFDSQRKNQVDALLKSLGFPSNMSGLSTSSSDSAPSPQSQTPKFKRKRDNSEESISQEDQPMLKKHGSSSDSVSSMVVRNQMAEIRQLLSLNNSASPADDTAVLNLVIKLLKEDSLSRRSLGVAMNAAPTFWPGYNYNGDALDNARTSTMKAVGISKEQFKNSADYHCVFENSPFAQAICSLDGRFVDCNQKFEEMTGYLKSQVAQTTLFATMDATEVPQFLACVESLISGKMKVYMKQRKCVHADGAVYMAQCFISVIRDSKTNAPLYFNCLGLPMFDQHP